MLNVWPIYLHLGSFGRVRLTYIFNWVGFYQGQLVPYKTAMNLPNKSGQITIVHQPRLL